MILAAWRKDWVHEIGYVLFLLDCILVILHTSNIFKERTDQDIK